MDYCDNTNNLSFLQQGLPKFDRTCHDCYSQMLTANLCNIMCKCDADSIVRWQCRQKDGCALVTPFEASRRNLQISPQYFQEEFTSSWTLAMFLTFAIFALISICRISRHFIQCSLQETSREKV